MIQDRPTKFPKNETFVARVFRRTGTDTSVPLKSVASAMDRIQEACDAGYEVTIRGQYTSDGTKHKNHGGRLVALCERKRWIRY